MDESVYARVRDVFMQAAHLVPAELTPFLDAACVDQPEVRRQVEELLGFVTEDAVFGDAPPADDPLMLCGQTLDGRCRIDAFVAEGGFSHVYRGWHVQRAHAVAIKLFKQALPTRMRADLEESFQREGALMTQIAEHTTGVVRAFEVGAWRDPRGRLVSYTVMEWLAGRPLDAVLTDDRRRWPLEEVLTRLAPIAQALTAAHAVGVAHRDVKPENIFDTADGARLLDFGVAKVATHLSQGFEATGSALSPVTVQYAAPEQVTKRLGATGPRTDVHGLALVCVEMLAGRRPYPSGNARAALLHVLAGSRPTPATLGVDVSAAVEQVFVSALALAPADRPADVATFWLALQAASRSAADPDAARPETPRFAWLRRRGTRRSKDS